MKRKKPSITIARRRLGNAILLTLFAAAALAYYLHGYWTHPVLPGKSLQYPLGWWGWWDQGQYYASVRALWNWDLTPGLHHYPIGYALVGALFYGLLPNHPLLIPNLVFYAVISAGFLALWRRILSTAECVVLAFVGIVWQKTVLENLIIPWTTIPRTAALYTLAWLGLYRGGHRFYPLASGLCLGFIYMVRPGDIVFCAPLAVPGLVDWFRRRRALEFAAKFLAGVLPPAAFFHAFNWMVFHGLWPTAYFTANRTLNGFSFAFIPAKALSMFINPQVLFGEPESLLSVYPYLMIALPGMAVFAKRLGSHGAALVGSQILCGVYYLGFNDFTPQNVFLFRVIHYLAWMLPFFAGYAYLLFRSAWHELGWRWTVALLAVSAGAVCLPEIVVKPVAAAFPGGRCATTPGAGCELRFLTAKAAFDVVLLENLRAPAAAITQVRLDNRVLLPRRDFRAVAPEDAPGMSLLFYTAERAASLTIVIETQPGYTPYVSYARYYLRAWSLALRDPMRLAHKSPARLHYANQADLTEPPSHPARALLPAAPRAVLHVAAEDGTDALLRRPYRVPIPWDFCVEAIVRTGDEQPTSAVILGNHPGTNLANGFMLEQDGNRTNHFDFVLGQGAGWMRAGEFILTPGRTHYIAACKTGRTVKLWLDGGVITEQKFSYDMETSDFPLRVGNWVYNDRPFHGHIQEIQLQAGTLTDQQVAARAAALRSVRH